MINVYLSLLSLQHRIVSKWVRYILTLFDQKMFQNARIYKCTPHSAVSLTLTRVLFYLLLFLAFPPLSHKLSSKINISVDHYSIFTIFTMESGLLPATFRKGATALITGAASGIGLATAQRCYSHGMNLVLVDNNATALSQATAKFPSDGRNTTTSSHILDVSSFDAWRQLVPKIESQFPDGIDFLMLNAGAGIRPNGDKGAWEDPTYFERTFAINTMGYTNGIVALLKMVTRNKDASRTIVMTGSKQGITNPPGNPAYNASKAAVRSIAEHLSFDLDKAAPNVSVHLLIPGWTYTGFNAGHFKEKPAGAWTSEQVVDFMMEKMAEKKFYILCPDNEVLEEIDRKRILWSTGDILEGRPPLSRWREEWKEEAKREIEG